MIDVLVVDDSLTTREYLRHIIESEPDLRLAGLAKNGKEAVVLAQQLKPSVIIMDIQMPEMNGYDATLAIMEKSPVPIVIHSTLVAPDQTGNIFQAMKAGAVAVSQKPPGIGHPESEVLVEKLVRTVKLMSEIKVVRRLKPRHRKSTADKMPPVSVRQDESDRIELIAIGASTGGPPVLQTLLAGLPEDFPIPILIVQHISLGFLEGMLNWLSKSTALCLKIARTGDSLVKGHVYFAPEDHYMEITPARQIFLSRHKHIVLMRRPITHLFSSVSRIFGSNAMGVLLTGMGNDGSVGLKEMNSAGALTIVQNMETSVVFGMPQEAIKLDAAAHVLSPAEITSVMNRLKRP